MPHLIIDDSYDVVFNPTASDWDNANETPGTAQQDILGLRYWLTKKEASQAYNFEGVGNYPGGPIENIGAILMEPENLDILAHSPRYSPYSFELLKDVSNPYFEAQGKFKNSVEQILNYLLTQEDPSPANMQLAYTVLSPTLEALNNLDFDNSYINIKDATPGGSLTAQIKTDIENLIKEYLKKYPR